MRAPWIRVAAAVLAAAALACSSPAPGTGDAPESTAGQPAPDMVGHVAVTLYYASSESPWLVPVQQEVPLADGLLAQGRQILAAQLGEAPEGLVSVFPTGTRLRGFYVTERGEAFVDLSPEVAASHPGGVLNEQLTVYGLVNAITTNLPAIERVQLLIGGREVDSLAGHVDLRRPLEPDPSLVRDADPD